MNISVIGLGKLGLCSAVCFASRGHKVVGVDENGEHVSQLQGGECPIDEPGLADMLSDCRGNLTFTDDAFEAVSCSDVTLIIVPTPSVAGGRFGNDYVENVLRSMAPAVAKKDTFHVVDVVSTVMPGSCDAELVPLLEELTDGRCGIDFGLVYNPEFIAIGSVIRDFLNPDMVLIGGSDDHSISIVKDLYESTCLSDPYFACMSLVNAEITKLSLNCYITMKISFANELASICERLEGANVDAITDAIGSDSRISRKYLKGGLGFGGPCFPRDNLAFQAFARELGTEARLGPEVVAVNDSVVERLLDIVRSRTAEGDRVAILGLPYKPGTGIVEESQSIWLVQRLVNSGYSVVVGDPRALGCAREVLGEDVEYAEDAYSCVDGADAAVFMTNWPEYAELDWGRIESAMNEGGLLVDSWRIAGEVEFERVNYFGLGYGERARVRSESMLDEAGVVV
jgi:UDPglucose 6-dehydrogenase